LGDKFILLENIEILFYCMNISSNQIILRNSLVTTGNCKIKVVLMMRIYLLDPFACSDVCISICRLD